jgi:NADPH:quinone reductase-like Zn-dependent oxidoreductase
MKLKRLLWRTVLVLGTVLLVAGTVAYWRSTNVCEAGPLPTPVTPMRALIACDYGPPEVLRIASLEKPAPAAGQVLVRVRAASVNPLDWHYLRGTPYVMRLDSGLRKPASIRAGVDFAGVVEAVGTGVTRFKPGDEVFGGRNGALAEYVVVSADRAIVAKPANLSFEQAAAVPVAAITALQGLRDKGRIGPGMKVLVNGASGGVGTFAVQIAKHYGAEVTGVCSTRNVALVKSIGADHVVDYTREDFTRRSDRYDILLDNVGNQSLAACRRVMAPGGRYVLVGGGGPRDHIVLGPFGRVAMAYAMSAFVSQEMGMFLAALNQRDLGVLADLLAAGRVVPVIDRQYPFARAADAIAYLEQGRARGKVVVTMD